MRQGLIETTDVAPRWVANMEFPIAENIEREIQRLADRGATDRTLSH